MFYILQAVILNMPPVLFITLRNEFSLSYMQLGSLISINFVTQIFTDIIFSRVADRHGYRPFLLVSSLLSIAGFVVFMYGGTVILPYAALAIGTVLFSIAGGLLEIIISPLINAIPSDSKGGSMAILHSFYAWGQFATVIITTLLLKLLGSENWRYIVLTWQILPIVIFLLTLKIPLPDTIPESKQIKVISVIKSPLFALFILIIFFGSATENTMVQWSSAFMEEAVKLPKVIGDIAGMSMFAFMLGLSRVISAVMAKKIHVIYFMLYGALGAVLCYIVVSLAPVPVLSLIFCAITGFASGMLWPGTLIIAAETFPTSGAWLFAYLAIAGDCGAAVGPYISGLVSDNAGLRAGMLVSFVYPLIASVCIIIYFRFFKRHKLR